MNSERSPHRNTPLSEDLLRLACASRILLEQRPDLRGISRAALAELTLRQIQRDTLYPEVLDAFSPACSYFRERAALTSDPGAQRQIAAAEIAYDRSNALPAALAGLALPKSCRAIAAEQLLAATDGPVADFKQKLIRFSS